MASEKTYPQNIKIFLFLFLIFSLFIFISVLGCALAEEKYPVFLFLFLLNGLLMFFSLAAIIYITKKRFWTIILFIITIILGIGVFNSAKDLYLFLSYGKKAFPHIQCVVKGIRIEVGYKKGRSYLICQTKQGIKKYTRPIKGFPRLRKGEKIVIITSLSNPNRVLWIEKE